MYYLKQFVQVKGGGSAKANKKTQQKQKYIIDASGPSRDKIFDPTAFVCI